MEVAPWPLAAIPGIRFGIFLCVSRIVRIVLQAGHWYIVPRVLWAGQAAPNYRSRTLTEPTPLPSPPPPPPPSSPSTSSSFALPPFAECTSPLPSPFQTPSPPLLSSLYTELSPGLGWIGWLPVFSDPWLRYPFTIPFRPSLSLSLLSSFSLLDGYRSIYPPLLFILILCFISVLPLQSLEIYSYLTRSPVSFSTSRNAFSWCSRSDTSLLSLQRCPCKSDLGSGNAKPLGSRRWEIVRGGCCVSFCARGGVSEKFLALSRARRSPASWLAGVNFSLKKIFFFFANRKLTVRIF